MNDEEKAKSVFKPNVKLKRTSKGITWEIMAYEDTVDKAKEEAIKIDGELLEKYKGEVSIKEK